MPPTTICIGGPLPGWAAEYHPCGHEADAVVTAFIRPMDAESTVECRMYRCRACGALRYCCAQEGPK